MNTGEERGRSFTGRERIMQFTFKTLFLFGLVSISLGTCCGICSDDSRDHRSKVRLEVSARNKVESGTNIGAFLTSIFQDHISPVDGDRCPSHPTCASYAIRAFRKHGFFIGWLMTVDRLIHEGDEAAVSPLVYHRGRIKILDPVENNDFWWSCREGKNAE